MGLTQSVQLVLTWLHGCMGLHFWLRLKPWYPRLAAVLYSRPWCCRSWPCSASVRPGGKSPVGPAAGWTEAAVQTVNAPSRPRRRFCSRPDCGCRRLCAQCARGVPHPGRPAARAPVPAGDSDHLPDRPDPDRPQGASVLQISRRAGIQHASVCGGRGRCSTCGCGLCAALSCCRPAAKPSSGC